MAQSRKRDCNPWKKHLFATAQVQQLALANQTVQNRFSFFLADKQDTMTQVKQEGIRATSSIPDEVTP